MHSIKTAVLSYSAAPPGSSPLVSNWIESHSGKTPPLCNSLIFSVHWGQGLVNEVYSLSRYSRKPQAIPSVSRARYLESCSSCIFRDLPMAWFHMNSFSKDSLSCAWLQDDSYSPILVFVSVCFLNHWMYGMPMVTSVSYNLMGCLGRANVVSFFE